MSLISVRDLVVEYDGRRVLDGLNLDIEPGQITVLRMLDFDHFGAQEDELVAAEGSCEDVGHVQNAHAVEGKRHF